MGKIWTIKFQLMNLIRLLPDLLFRRANHIHKPLHILFCMVDHYEPGHGNVSTEIEKQRIGLLLSKYPELAEKHGDSYGNLPKRTWFFPPHYHRNNNMNKLVSLCKGGYGEIELHLHHGKSKPDTPENLRNTIQQCIKEYSRFGIFGTEHQDKRYGFIHGNSALDNSRNGKYCGVNSEIEILKETGCYADFTFPCSCEANPYQINSIYYALDNPNKPKSYNSGLTVERNSKASDGLMIIQGPLYPYLKNGKLSNLRLYGPVIDGKFRVDRKRIEKWIQTGIHIKGCKEWIIIKLHTHGAVESDAVLGDEMDYVFNYLETTVANGSNTYLHYVTARELYNVIKAIEKGEDLTNPEDYRDYKVKPPVYQSLPETNAASDRLQELVNRTYI